MFLTSFRCPGCGVTIPSEIMNSHICAKPKTEPQSKPDLSFMPFSAEVEAAVAFEVGAIKYGRDDYKRVPISAVERAAAIKRHIGKWLQGEELDPDGQTHLGAIIADAAILIECKRLGNLIDDRFKK